MSQTLSVVLCTYNGEPYIAEQLASVLAQTLPPVEIIVSDDGSTDDTLGVVARIAATSPIPIRVRRNPERLGFADNFLGACDSAVGDLLAFCDQDDVWLPEKLAQQVAALERSKAAVSAHDVWEMYADGSPKRKRRSRTERRERVVTDRTGDPWGNYLGNTLVFRRDLLDHIPADARGDDPFTFGVPLSHDRWLYFLGSTFGGIVILPQRLAHYRLHEGQLYGTEVARSVRERLRGKWKQGRMQALTLAGIAEDRAVLLERFVPDSVARDRSIERWREVQRRFQRGALLYDLSLWRRMGRVIGNIGHGDYLPIAMGGLGTRRLLQDGCIALLASFNIDKPVASGARA